MKIGKNIVTPIVWSYFSYFSFCPDPSFQTLSDLRVSIYREHRYIMNDLNELSCSVVFFLQLFIIKFYSFLHFYAFCNCIISLPPLFFYRYNGRPIWNDGTTGSFQVSINPIRSIHRFGRRQTLFVLHRIENELKRCSRTVNCNI